MGRATALVTVTMEMLSVVHSFSKATEWGGLQKILRTCWNDVRFAAGEESYERNFLQ